MVKRLPLLIALVSGLACAGFRPHGSTTGIVLGETSLLTGSASRYYEHASLFYDAYAKKYCLYVVALDGVSAPWCVYYGASVSLSKLKNIRLTELYGGITNRYTSNHQQNIAVHRPGGDRFIMWYSTYWATHPRTGQWSNFLHYRTSLDGVAWSGEKIFNNPGGLSDERMPIPVELTDHRIRIYYDHQEEDEPAQSALRLRCRDTDGDSFSTSDWQQVGDRPLQMIGGYRMTGQHIRLWACDPIDFKLYRLDSADQGLTWREQCIGEYQETGIGRNRMRILSGFYDPKTGKEYFLKTYDNDAKLVLEEILQTHDGIGGRE